MSVHVVPDRGAEAVLQLSDGDESYAHRVTRQPGARPVRQPAPREGTGRQEHDQDLLNNVSKTPAQ